MTEYALAKELEDLRRTIPHALPFLLHWGNTAGYNVAGGGVRFIDAWNRVDGVVVGSTEDNSFILIPVAGVLHTLGCKVATSIPAGITFTVTLRINGVDTALFFTMGAGDTSKILYNLRVKVAEMSKISVKVNADGTYNSGALLVAAYVE